MQNGESGRPTGGRDGGAGAAGKMNLFELERTTLRDLVSLVESRAVAETGARGAYAAESAAAEKDVARARKQVGGGREREFAVLTESHQRTIKEIADRYRSDGDAADREYGDVKRLITEECDDIDKTARATLHEARWTADSVYEAAEKHATDDRADIRRKAAATTERVEGVWARAAAPLARSGLNRPVLEGPAGAVDVGVIVDAAAAVEVELAAAEGESELLRSSRGLKLVGVGGFVVWLVPLAVLAAVPSLFVEDKLLAVIGGAAVAVALAAGGHWLTRRRSLAAAASRGRALAIALARAAAARATVLSRADGDHARRVAAAATARDDAKRRADDTARPILDASSTRRKSELGETADRYTRSKEKLRGWRADASDKAEEHYSRESKACMDRHGGALSAAEREYGDRRREAAEALAAAERVIAVEWRDGQDRVGRALNKLRANGLEHFPDWGSPFWYNPPAAIRVPTGVRFGDFDIDLTRLPGGLPTDEDEVPTLPVRMRLPAFLPFPDKCSLLLKAKDAGRPRAVQALQAIMLRLLTAIPPGKLRFTIIDPVGLGENFAAFMHLADYDEQLVGSRIWTEPPQIEKRLADVTAHMETVIQKYLRNQYKTIEAYNAHAGEVAEPFRVLVVANFPANFTLEAARRLVSIVNSGPSCGVYTLITHDPKQPLPQGFNLSDLEQGSINLLWKDETFVWKDPDFSRFPLELEVPPDLSEVTRLVRLVGERSRDANRVEVPFDYVAPRPIEIWASDSRNGLAVAVGRAGATKRQMFAVGKGTAQHALVAGKTGSGKSTLLHALITNVALNYSPDEVELYLIDFKKGVEFKAYANNRLPHARAVAIESEREFGLSVLQRLDAELKDRGELFRSANVNSLSEYRDYLDKHAPPANSETSFRKMPTCPRILLVVDEFQEFFVEDDRVAQECALLLDRLVRQGRAFGLHLVLGSQTLGGAYSLARSTIDQMAVRIALQCSDADAQLILSKDNTAARLLSRPGEAIYNDANGLVEGNDLFQVVWLDDDRRDQLLGDIRRRADASGRNYPSPLVFEGNVPARIEADGPLTRLLAEPTWPAVVRAASVWLGDAVAIKDPTAAVFRPVGGHNMLMVGQHDEAALAIISAALVALSAQYATGSAKYIVLDGTPDDDPNAGLLGRVASALPNPVTFVDRSDLGTALSAVAAEVIARQKGESADKTPCYVFVVGAQRYRDLRKDDDFGFGRRGADRTVSPGEHLSTISRDGPTVNVFLILWADTPTNLGRCVDRAGLREYGLRVLFQMNANDSSALIDSPAASRLGRNRALFVTEETAQPEKFRPYGLPTAAWLATVKERLGSRTSGP